jgi:hypothetical protein
MAFRDQTTVLREELEAARAKIASLERENAELAAKHSPLVRTLATGIAVGLVLAAGIAWHLGMQNQGLSARLRAAHAQTELLRQELDRALEAQELAAHARE